MCAASNESEVEFWRLPRVIAATGLSKTEIYRRAGQGRFPAPRRYPGTTKTFWLSTEVRTWQAELLAAAPSAPGRSAT